MKKATAAKKTATAKTAKTATAKTAKTATNSRIGCNLTRTSLRQYNCIGFSYTVPVAKNPLVAVVPVVPVAKKGTKRIANKKTCDSLISRFVMQTIVPVNARIDAQKALASALKPLPEKTIFGHNSAYAMTSVIDDFLVEFATTGNCNSLNLLEKSINAYTTTAKTAGMHTCQVIDATFVKVINHLNNFDSTSSRYKKYLSQKQPNKRYNAIQLANFIDGFKPICKALASDFALGKKAAKVAYAKQWAELKKA